MALTTSACAEVINLGPEREAAGEETPSDPGPTACNFGVVLWTKQFGDKAAQTSAAIAPDGSGGVFVAGSFAGQLDLGGDPLVSTGDNEIFVARLDGDGRRVWATQFGDGGGGVLAVAPTPNGGVAVSGEFRGPVDFGDGTVHTPGGLADGFVALYDEHGNHMWHRIVTGPKEGHSDLCRKVAVYPDGSLAVGIIFSDTIEPFDAAPVTAAGMKDMLLVKLDPMGLVQWSRHMGGEADDVLDAVALDNQGKIVIGGGSTGNIDLGTGLMEVPDEDGWDALLGAYDPVDGEAIHVDRFGGSGDTGVWQLAIDPATNDAIFSGVLKTNEPASFGGGSLEATNGVYLARLEENGEHVASKAVANVHWVRGVTVHPDGSVFVAARFAETTINFGGESVKPVGGYDGVVAKLDPELERLWTLRIASAKDDDIASVAVDDQSNAFVLAHFQETIELSGCPPLTSRGASDLVLMKLRP